MRRWSRDWVRCWGRFRERFLDAFILNKENFFISDALCFGLIKRLKSNNTLLQKGPLLLLTQVRLSKLRQIYDTHLILTSI